MQTKSILHIYQSNQPNDIMNLSADKSKIIQNRIYMKQVRNSSSISQSFSSSSPNTHYIRYNISSSISSSQAKSDVRIKKVHRRSSATSQRFIESERLNRRDSISFQKNEENDRVSRRRSLHSQVSECTGQGSVSSRNSDELSNASSRRASLPGFVSSAANNHYLVGTERRYQRLAQQKFKEKKWDESADYFANLLKIQEDRLGKDHPEVAQTKYNVARSFYKLALKEEATCLLVEALEILLIYDDKKSVLTCATVLDLISIIEEEKGDIDNAVFYLEEMQKFEVKGLGYKSKKSIRRLSHLSGIYSFSRRVSFITGAA